MGLYIILQRYGDPQGVTRHHAEHAAWIERYADDGVILLAGQTEPTGGSVIVVNAATRTSIDAILQEDAFFAHGVVTSTEVTEFRPRRGALRKFASNPLHVPAD